MFRSTSRRVALATEGTQESLSLSHFNRKIASPVGPYFFSRGRVYFFSQIDNAKIRHYGCGSRILSE